jgi:hypothetical protein
MGKTVVQRGLELSDKRETAKQLVLALCSGFTSCGSKGLDGRSAAIAGLFACLPACLLAWVTPAANVTPDQLLTFID